MVCPNDWFAVIAIDTSALMAIVLDEPEAEACASALEAEPDVLISAGTLAEVLIVAARRNVATEMAKLTDGLGFEVVTVTPASARRVAEAYANWGKGVHPAGLNFGDCFAYEVAREHGCRLLFIGDDFTKTDLESVL
jgi:ribonuclease VapC